MKWARHQKIILRILRHEVPRIRKHRDGKNAGCCALRRGQNRELVSNGYRVSVWQYKKSSEDGMVRMAVRQQYECA